MKLYVSNLSFNTSEDALASLFAPFGEVVSTKIIQDRETGRSRGFGFVEMGSEEEGNAAIQSLNGQQVNGRPVNVSVAIERTESRPQGGGFNRSNNGGGYGGRRY